jgi:hypothetical protein
LRWFYLLLLRQPTPARVTILGSAPATEANAVIVLLIGVKAGGTDITSRCQKKAGGGLSPVFYCRRTPLI